MNIIKQINSLYLGKAKLEDYELYKRDGYDQSDVKKLSKIDLKRNSRFHTFMVYICINFIVIYSQIDIEVVAWFYFYICNGWSGRGKCADKSERVIII